MAKEALFVVALLTFAVAFRAWRKNWARKAGVLCILAAAFLAVFFITNSLWASAFSLLSWFFLPWIDLLVRVKKLRFPSINRLRSQEAPEDDFFPNASKSLVAMSEADFEHVGNLALRLIDTDQFYRLHWNPEERAIAILCLCEKENMAFAFVNVISQTEDGRLFQTTNYPYSPRLKSPPGTALNHLPCEKNCFHQVLNDHRNYLKRKKISEDDLMFPDPDTMGAEVQSRVGKLLDYNLKIGTIAEAEEDLFRYTTRGLFFIWKQSVKDMIRLC